MLKTSFLDCRAKTVVVPDVLRLSMVDAVHDGQDLSVSAQPEKKTANAAEEEEESADNAVKERMRRATMAKKGPTPPGVGGEAGGGATDAGAGAAEL